MKYEPLSNEMSQIIIISILREKEYQALMSISIVNVEEDANH